MEQASSSPSMEKPFSLKSWFTHIPTVENYFFYCLLRTLIITFTNNIFPNKKSKEKYLRNLRNCQKQHISLYIKNVFVGVSLFP